MKKFIHGMDELRTLIDYGNHSNESAFDGFNAVETVRLLQACIALDLEVFPDQLTPMERRHAVQTGKITTAALHRLYKAEGLAETGPDWVGR